MISGTKWAAWGGLLGAIVPYANDSFVEFWNGTYNYDGIHVDLSEALISGAIGALITGIILGFVEARMNTQQSGH